ncbi:MAG: TraR/DksA C4-type zinc finger protein [Pseudomonadota bacterium]
MFSKKQTDRLNEVLQEAVQRLLTNAQSALKISMDRETDIGRDSIDQSSSEELLSTTLRLRDREQKLLKKIRNAISRLEDGTIDECEECGDPIGFERLLARPVTTLCIGCKESAEEGERHVSEEDELL